MYKRQRFNIVADSADSMLAAVGRFIAPVFAPLGFGDWRAATALISGFTMKEAVVSTFAVLVGGGSLNAALAGIFTPLAAFAFLIFTLLYTPCVAAIGAVRRELDSRLAAVGLVFFQTGVAWAAAFAVYQVGRLLGF